MATQVCFLPCTPSPLCCHVPLPGGSQIVLADQPVIIPGMLLLATAMIVLAFSTAQFGMLSAAILQGFGFGGVQPALMAQVVDQSTDHDRGPALATLMGAFDVGVGLSSIGLGLVLEATDFTTTFLCAAAIGLLGAGLSAWSAFFREAETLPSVEAR